MAGALGERVRSVGAGVSVLKASAGCAENDAGCNSFVNFFGGRWPTPTLFSLSTRAIAFPHATHATLARLASAVQHAQNRPGSRVADCYSLDEALLLSP